MLNPFAKPSKVPVILITGFLGSGKTTLINWLIQHLPQHKISLILNEFGDIKLESQFIEHKGVGQIAELSNGCMCCVAKSDIPRVVTWLLSKTSHLDYILIEASGLSDPDPIHDSFEDPNISAQVFLSHTICIIDAVHFEQTRIEHQIIMSQLADADLILISKATEVEADQLGQLQSHLTNLTTAQVLSFTDSIDPQLLLTVKKPSLSQKDESTNHDHTHEAYQQWWFTSKESISPDSITKNFTQLPSTIVRAKGYFNHQGSKQMVQYVNGRLDISPAKWEPNQAPSTAILFLGKKFDIAKLESLFQAI